MERMKNVGAGLLKELTKTILLFALVSYSSILAQSTILVDFGKSAAENIFGLTGWTELIKSPNVNYTAVGPGGLIPNTGVEEYDDYQGVRGSPREFKPGERIVVSWFNTSDDTYSISARISFTDIDKPNEDGSEGKWYTMRSINDFRNTYSEILPHSSAKTVFNITDHGVHKCDNTFSLVNVNLHIEWHDPAPKPFILCDKIELFNDADIEAPTAPTNLSPQVISNSKIKLSWDESSDNIGVVEYLIYNNNEVEGYSRTNNYTAVLLESGTEYSFTVTALDKNGNESEHSASVSASTSAYGSLARLVNPVQLKYLGAFRLPEPFSYGADALAYCSDGDGGQSGSGADDGYPGSLFVTDLNVPEGGFVAEVTIPAPTLSLNHNIDDLNEVSIIQQPTDVRPPNIVDRDFVDLWKNGLVYVESEKRLYSSWSIYYTVTGEKHPAISFCNANDLSGSQKFGGWYVGNSPERPNDAMAYDYLFAVPQDWADQNIFGRSLITGRSREGGLSGLGPTFYAINLFGNETPPQPGAELEMTTLLEYGSVEGTDNYNYPNSFVGYNHADWWRDAFRLQYGEQQAFVIIGTKALGNNWYGYHGEKMRHEWIIADLPYPEFWETDPDGKGWRSDNSSTMMIFYDPNDLISVAQGSMQSYEPEPYASFRMDSSVLWGPNKEIASASYDVMNKNLFVAEFNAPSDGIILIHVFKIDSPPTSVHNAIDLPSEFTLEQNYPNPFNPVTKIKYSIAREENVVLKVFDVLGREVITLINEDKVPGYYEAELNMSKYPSGIYIYSIKAGSYSQVKKLVLLK